MNRMQRAEQFRRALQLFALSLDEEAAMEIATVYDAWKTDKLYKSNEYITYGLNSVGDPQLYKVIQTHTSQSDWTPDATPALYQAIGLADDGVPIWSQPTGAHDAYNSGDIVWYPDKDGNKYKSLIDGNVWSPEAYPTAWEVL